MRRKRVEVYFYGVYSIKILRGSYRSAKWNIEIVNFSVWKTLHWSKIKSNWARAKVEFAENVIMLSELISKVLRYVQIVQVIFVAKFLVGNLYVQFLQN